MDLVRYVIRSLFRHVLWLVAGPVFVGLLMYYFTRNLEKRYEVNSTVFTGITSNNNPDGMGLNTTVANTNLENLQSVIRSRATLERVSLKLFTQAMIHGDPEKDNIYITAASYRNLMRIVPEKVLQLIDKNSEERTFENLQNFLEPSRANFIYGLLNWYHPHYSIDALNKIKVRRVPSSDMLEISYSANDPGIAFQTLEILNKEFIYIFSEIRFSDSNEIIGFFEQEVQNTKKTLEEYEDSLLQYQTKNRIINYGEQTEALASRESDFFVSSKQLLMDYAAAQSALLLIEVQMEGRENLYINNNNFMSLIKDIASISSAIVRMETLLPDSVQASHAQLQQYRRELEKLEQTLQFTSQEILSKQNTKEGIASESIVTEWLKEKIAYEKSRAALEVLQEERGKMDDLFDFYAPIGVTLTRKNREINLTEQAYLQLTQALISARLRLKNLQMSLGNVSIVTPPIYPLQTLRTNRKILVFVSMGASFVFILCFFLILEIVDQTLRNVYRARRLVGADIVGAIPRIQSGYTEISEEILREKLAPIASHLGKVIMKELVPEKQTWINVWSSREGDGKSTFCHMMQRFFAEKGYQSYWLEPGMNYTPGNKKYIESRTPNMLIDETQKINSWDLAFIELPCAQKNPYPNHLLRDARINILICDAEKGWQTIDKESFERVLSQTGGKHMVILNRSNKDDAELFTGLLPPYYWWRKIRYRLFNLELTSRWKDN